MRELIAMVGVLLPLFLSMTAQQEPAIVKLTVKHDGRERPAPDHVTLTFQDRSVRLPIRDSKFEVPIEFLRAPEVTIATDLGRDQIRVTRLSGKLIAYENWTLLLAERRYGEDHQSAVPKGANIRTSCMIVFESAHYDPGVVVFVTSCRKKTK